MNKENWLLIGILIALIVGLAVGHQVTKTKYTKEIKGLTEGFEISCDGINLVNDAMRPLAYLTGIYAPTLDCEKVINDWRYKYK